MPRFARWAAVRRCGFGLRAIAALVALLAVWPQLARAADRVEQQFDGQIRPILEDYCYGCHGNGLKKGGVKLDGFLSDQARLRDHDLWWRVLKNVRAGIMPPNGKPRPADQERRRLEDWIKYGAFGIDPKNPDPGRVTVRRLNRVEYRNTVRDLMGVDYDTTYEFPPDDTGHGFDNIGDVLTLSPLLLEKYVAAAKSVVSQSVPTTSRIVAEKLIPGRRFRTAGGGAPPATAKAGRSDGALSLSYYEPAAVSTVFKAEHAGRYQLVVDLSANEKFVDNAFDLNRCRLVFKVDGKERLSREYSRQEGKPFHDEIEQDWQAGEHQLAFDLKPLTPGAKQVRSLAIRILSVAVRGPLNPEHQVRPRNYARFFPRDVPESPAERLQYARELLDRFATRAFRRPVARATVERLAALAESVYSQPRQSFEAGIAQAMTAVLASPGFVFREEAAVAGSADPYPLIDEYALASRLSYFLWSTLPDDELIRLAAAGKLRQNLSAQVARMLADGRSDEFVRHFVGQWLQARDIDSVPINAFAVITRDEPQDPDADRRRTRFRELNRKPAEKLTASEKKELEAVRGTFFRSFRRFRDFELNGDLRRAMRRETEMLFGYVVRENRSLLELIDCDYTFLNERLAKHYGITDVKGEQMRRVALPAGSPRGGVLTQGTVLAVTSNPDRTSPVKRGLFILDNILGSPPAPPPPNIPPLEDAGKQFGKRKPTLRETLAVHRQAPSCMACHDRMDPLGLALENFNALGRFREKDRGQPVDSSGKLITGEPFKNCQDLKRILVKERYRDFYRCLSEKLLTYALGRGLDYYDVEATDVLVERLEKTGGKASELLIGVVESAAFQRTRRPAGSVAPEVAGTSRLEPQGQSGVGP
ncbi:MAG: DUF1592 domain-containing protein [Isosphaeraceae bacterium]